MTDRNTPKPAPAQEELDGWSLRMCTQWRRLRDFGLSETEQDRIKEQFRESFLDGWYAALRHHGLKR